MFPSFLGPPLLLLQEGSPPPVLEINARQEHGAIQKRNHLGTYLFGVSTNNDSNSESVRNTRHHLVEFCDVIILDKAYHSFSGIVTDP